MDPDNWFSGVTIVHLPTGETARTILSPQYRELGILTFVDYSTGMAYTQGVGFEDRYEQDKNALKKYKVKVLKQYFFATPVKVPKFN